MTKSHTCSAVTGDGIPDIWRMVEKFHNVTMSSVFFQRRLRTQMLSWVHAMVREYLQEKFLNHPAVITKMPAIEEDVMNGQLSATLAVKELIGIFEG